MAFPIDFDVCRIKAVRLFKHKKEEDVPILAHPPVYANFFRQQRKVSIFIIYRTTFRPFWMKIPL